MRPKKEESNKVGVQGRDPNRSAINNPKRDGPKKMGVKKKPCHNCCMFFFFGGGGTATKQKVSEIFSEGNIYDKLHCRERTAVWIRAN